MTNIQYLSQVGHFLAGGALLLLAGAFSAVLGGGWSPVLITLGVGIVAVTWKEFWYDLRYETPKQTLGDSLMDFAFYVLGGLVGTSLSAWLLHLAKAHCS